MVDIQLSDIYAHLHDDTLIVFYTAVDTLVI